MCYVTIISPDFAHRSTLSNINFELNLLLEFILVSAQNQPQWLKNVFYRVELSSAGTFFTYESTYDNCILKRN